MIKIVLFTLFSISLFAKNLIMPVNSFKVDGSVTDLVYKNGKIYVSTDASCVDIIDEKTKKIKKIILPKIKDFMGDEIDSKIYSVDILNNNILLLSQGEHGFRELYIYDTKLNKIISIDDKLYITKAKFLNKNTVILGLLSNEIISYDILKHKKNWITQASQSKFSNFVLNEKKTEVVIADESGDLKIIDTKTGKILKILSGKNVDNVFDVDYKNGIIATAGQDRRVVVYNLATNSSYYKLSNFLIYTVGLSPSADFIAYASDENNNVTVFNRYTKSDIATFTGNNMTLTKIVFKNEKEFFVTSDDKMINLFKLK